MSKKKNTLKDLDEFLKQQASTLVTPSPLGDSVPESTSVQKSEPAPSVVAEISAERILEDIKNLAAKEGAAFRKTFYDLIIQSIESQKVSSAEDKMLINTALYLKSGSNWKNVIREYWKHHS